MKVSERMVSPEPGTNPEILKTNWPNLEKAVDS